MSTTVLILLALVVLVNGVFALRFLMDLKSHWHETLHEPGSPVAMSISQLVIYFLSTMGISDFAIGASVYPGLKWVDAKRLPGTLNTACVIPVATMALCYVSSVKVDLWTLIVPIIAQVVGAYISPRYVAKLPARTIKKLVIIGLIVSGLMIFAGLMGWLPSGGDASSLAMPQLIILGVLSFIYGALNNMGIGSYPLTMATVYALGLSPLAAFPIMMGACTFSVPIGSMQFIKLDCYSRKITLFSATAGVIGVLIAAFVVTSLNMTLLKWLAILVIAYSAITMIYSLRKTA